MLRIQMDPMDSPATPRIAKIIAKIVTLHVCCSLSLVIIYKKQYHMLWTKPEMSERKAHYLMEEPIKKVSV